MYSARPGSEFLPSTPMTFVVLTQSNALFLNVLSERFRTQYWNQWVTRGFRKRKIKKASFQSVHLFSHCVKHKTHKTMTTYNWESLQRVKANPLLRNISLDTQIFITLYLDKKSLWGFRMALGCRRLTQGPVRNLAPPPAPHFCWGGEPAQSQSGRHQEHCMNIYKWKCIKRA